MSLDLLQQIVNDSSRIVFFGGAGVSTESGIPDFRSVDGLYSLQYKYPPETILSRSFFMTHTAEFYDFYRNKLLYSGAKPNMAHIKLAELEHAGKLAAVITQNIDGLHQLAGSVNVLELHGSVHRNYCQKCRRFYEMAYIQQSEGVPVCECGGTIKPDVVLYEEPLLNSVMEAAVKAISGADLMIVGGTSLAVYPAAGLVDYFGGEALVLINKAPTPYDRQAQLVISAPIGETLGALHV